MQNIERYREGSERQLKATEELVNRKFERDMKLQEAAGKTAAEREAWGFVKQVVPTMLERVSGGKLPSEAVSGVLGMVGPDEPPPTPEAAAAEGSPLVTLLRSMNQQQLGDIDRILTTEQRLLLNAAAQREVK